MATIPLSTIHGIARTYSAKPPPLGSNPAVRPTFLYAGHCEKVGLTAGLDRKSTRLNSSHVRISYAVFCLKKKNQDILPPVRCNISLPKINSPRLTDHSGL